jgi:NitT/TauT family transport system ATP-binding protein
MVHATATEPSGAAKGDRVTINVEVKGLTMSFETRGGRMTVLDNVDLSLPGGTFCCIVGPSGCGKSTMLRIVDGLLPCDSGEVNLGGERVRQPSLERGFVFQQFNLLPWRTVIGNVEFGLENLKVEKKERRQRAHKWLELVDLKGFEDHYPAQLSGGMQQRVGLARALAVEPEILLMDEPFGSVDDQTRMLLQEELLRIWERDHKTVLFVTHDIEEALFLGDVVVVMSPRPGRILKTVEVPFARPRKDELRGEAEFARVKQAIWEQLRDGVKEHKQAHQVG